jgi:hypothetical protein
LRLGQTPGIHDRIKATTDIDPDTRRAYASRLRGYLGSSHGDPGSRHGMILKP